MLRNRRLYLLVAVVMILSMALSACGPKVDIAKKTLNQAWISDAPTLDPGLSTDTTSTQVTMSIFMGLTSYDDKTIETLPSLASKWEVSSDGLTWTFTMRKDVNWVRYDPATKKWEKKRAVTAQDIEYAVKRTLDPKTASDYAYVLFIVKNGQPFNQGKVTDANEVGVKAVDDSTVKFTLEQPAGYFPMIAGMWVCNPVPKEVIDQFGDKWTEAGNIWTCGPYGLGAWEHDAKLVLLKNPYYFDVKNVDIEQVNFLIVPEESTQMAMYENGELDSVAVPSADIDRIKADAKLSKEFFQGPNLCTYYYGFNTTKPPLDNVKVRQALSYAFDRQKLIDTVLKGGQLPANCFAHPAVFGSPANDPSFKGITFDPAKGKALLAEAGYPDGKGLPAITLMFNTSQGHQQIAEFAQQTWKENLGVTVNLANQEWSVYLKTVNGQDTPQVYRMGWCADYPDENNWVLENFHSTKSLNNPKMKNAEFDKAMEDAAASSDPAKRKQLYFRAEQILCVEQAAIIPVYFYTRNTCTKPYVTRTYGPMGTEHYERWKLAK